MLWSSLESRERCETLVLCVQKVLRILLLFNSTPEQVVCSYYQMVRFSVTANSESSILSIAVIIWVKNWFLPTDRGGREKILKGYHVKKLNYLQKLESWERKIQWPKYSVSLQNAAGICYKTSRWEGAMATEMKCATISQSKNLLKRRDDCQNKVHNEVRHNFINEKDILVCSL